MSRGQDVAFKIPSRHQVRKRYLAALGQTKAVAASPSAAKADKLLGKVASKKASKPQGQGKKALDLLSERSRKSRGGKKR